VKARERSSNRRFLSSGLAASKVLLKTLPPKIEPVCRPAGPILPNGGDEK